MFQLEWEKQFPDHLFSRPANIEQNSGDQKISTSHQKPHDQHPPHRYQKTFNELQIKFSLILQACDHVPNKREAPQDFVASLLISFSTYMLSSILIRITLMGQLLARLLIIDLLTLPRSRVICMKLTLLIILFFPHLHLSFHMLACECFSKIFSPSAGQNPDDHSCG